MVLDLLVIGAGPAGVAAACEASRLGASVLLVDARGEAGGTIRLAHETRHIPFLEDRSSGEVVASRLRLKASATGQVERVRIVSVGFRTDTLIARAHDTRVFESRNIIIATGTRPVVPVIPGLPSAIEPPWADSARAVSSAAGAHVAVVGASDVAFDQARALQCRGAQTTVLCRAQTPRAPMWLRDAAAREGVELICDAQVVSGARSHRGVRLHTQVRGEEQVFEFDSIVAAAGRVPCLPEGVDELPRDHARVVGDACGRRARHVAIAMGEGCLAAFELLQGETES